MTPEPDISVTEKLEYEEKVLLFKAIASRIRSGYRSGPAPEYAEDLSSGHAGLQ
ncbi:MAG: hypothetical protein LUQ71_01185 [Methanoregula sp.]|nr:hypothetical protein [Methanoregula sp.]